MANLFESVQLGSLVLANRVFMAPLTRNRADADGVPGELAATSLLTARFGWTHRDRGDADLAHGQKATSILRGFIPPNRCANHLSLLSCLCTGPSKTRRSGLME
jgi:hypothetical protein